MNGGNRHISIEDGKTGSGWQHNCRIQFNRHYENMRYSACHREGDTRTAGNVWGFTGTTYTGLKVTEGQLAYGNA